MQKIKKLKIQVPKITSLAHTMYKKKYSNHQLGFKSSETKKEEDEKGIKMPFLLVKHNSLYNNG